MPGECFSVQGVCSRSSSITSSSWFLKMAVGDTSRQKIWRAAAEVIAASARHLSMGHGEKLGVDYGNSAFGGRLHT